MSKVPQRGEVWQLNEGNTLFYVVAVEKNSIKCLTKDGERYGIFSINKYDFIVHRHYVGWARIDASDIFERVNYE